MPIVEEASDLLIEGNNFYYQGKYTDALKFYRKALEYNNAYVDAYYNCGLASAALGKESEAIEYYEKAIELEPDFSPPYTSLGLIYSDKKEHQKALEYFEKVIQLKPNDPVAYNDYGNTLLNSGEYDKAIDYYKKAIEFDKKFVYAVYNWGLALERKKETDEAIKKYNEAIKINPEYLPASKNLAWLYTSERNTDESIKIYEKIVKIRNADKYDIADAYNNWGNILYDFKKYDEAKEKYNNAISDYPEFVYSYHNIGLCLRNQKNFSEAIEYFNKALEIDPAYLESYKYLAEAYIELKEYSKSIEVYRKIFKLEPERLDVLADYGIALSKTKNYFEAINTFILTIEKSPKEGIPSEDLSRCLINIENQSDYIQKIRDVVDKIALADIYNDWGNTFYYLKRFDDAIEQYKKSIQISPDFAYAYHNWGLSLEYQQDYDQAIIQYSKALELDPNYVNSHNSLGLTYLKSKKYQEAITHFEKAIELLPDFSNAYLNYGDTLLKMGKYEEAVEQYKKAAEFDPVEGVDPDKLCFTISKIDNKERVIQYFNKVIENKNSFHGYCNWANTLFALQRYPEAITLYRKADKINPSAYTYHNIGLVYYNLKQYENAASQYKKAIEVDKNFCSAYYNYAFLYDRKGDYKSAKTLWEKASEIYENTKIQALEDNNAEHFLYWGDILHTVLKDYKKAIESYKTGLSIEPENFLILVNLVNLYLELKNEITGTSDENIAERNSAHWHAFEYFTKAESVLKRLAAEPDEEYSFLYLGDLYLITENYDEAENYYMKSLEKNKNSSRIYAKLGVLFMRREEYKKAIKYFENAVKFDPDDLTLQSNLAESYLRADMPEKAEVLFKKVLEISPTHLESLIGLGEVYNAMAEKDDADMYMAAQSYFTKAINSSHSENSSKRLKKKELAAVYYSRGYVRVKAFEAAKIIRDENLLKQALEDFKLCYKLDPDNYKAKRAVEKIEKRFGYHSIQWLTEKAGPRVIFFVSLLFLLLAQWTFFIGKPNIGEEEYSITSETINSLKEAGLPAEVLKSLVSVQDYTFKDKNKFLDVLKTNLGEANLNKFKSLILENLATGSLIKNFQPIDTGYYVLLTFGSIIFMIAGLYLPQLLKLKVGGIELEKSSVDQVKTGTNLSIGKSIFKQDFRYRMLTGGQYDKTPKIKGPEQHNFMVTFARE